MATMSAPISIEFLSISEFSNHDRDEIEHSSLLCDASAHVCQVVRRGGFVHLGARVLAWDKLEQYEIHVARTGLRTERLRMT